MIGACAGLTHRIRLFISNDQQFCSFECTRGRVHASLYTNITPPYFFPQSLPTPITLPASVHHGLHTCSFQRSSALAIRPAKWCHQSLLRQRFRGSSHKAVRQWTLAHNAFLHELSRANVQLVVS